MQSVHPKAHNTRKVTKKTPGTCTQRTTVMSNFTSLLIDYYIQHNSAYFMSVLQNGRHVITLLFGQDLCPLKDENSFVSDLQEIANSATK
jgi:hypothetical protein